MKKEKGLSQSLAEDIQQTAPAYYEHDFYFNRLKKAVYLALYMVMFSGGLYFIWIGRIIMAGILIVPGSFLIPFAYKEFMDKSPQIRIAATGIWIKDIGYKPWEKIQRVYLQKDKSGKNVITKLNLYLLNSNDDSPNYSIEVSDMKQWREIKNIIPGYPQVNFESDY